ncbi:MAG: hypothetical protein MJ128_06485 [Mogibacterium sp.]|nr:hypothetical protein [Mogibacterium sp.]
MGRKYKKMHERILAVTLCALISFTYIPFPVYADDDEIDKDASETVELIEAEETQIIADDTQEDADDLLEGYMDSRIKTELSGAKRKADESKRRETLNNNEKILYDRIKTFIDRVASGGEKTATTTIDVTEIFRPYLVQSSGYNAVTSKSLGISSAVYVKKNIDGNTFWTFSDEAKAKLYDFESVYNALMADEPYAFYWFDKTEGVLFGLDVLIDSSASTSNIYFKGNPAFTLMFTVSHDYRAEGGSEYDVDTSKTSATSAAVSNAAGIITANSSKTDYAILNAYKEAICSMTDYDDDAADEGNNVAYGDPWQMIYVFDGDKDTNVVCEGYAKAFQYLCDNTDFKTDIDCDSVTGYSLYGPHSGPHMWNILHMDDGNNYLADITNSDTDAIGVQGGLFISPAMEGGSVDNGYSYNVAYNNISTVLTYLYDSYTRRTFSDDELTMSSDGYVQPAHVIPDAEYAWADDGKSCIASGMCIDCNETITDSATITSSVSIPATCKKKGTTKYTARFTIRGFKTQRKEIEDIPVNDKHSWDSGKVTKAAAEGVTGVRTYTCSVCSKTKTESIPAIVLPTDLPAVKIAKPSVAKKKLTAKWKKVSKKNQKKIGGIEIQVQGPNGYNKTFTAGKSKTSKKITKLKSKKKYSVRIRAYKWIGGVKHVSKWTKWKKVKVK